MVFGLADGTIPALTLTKERQALLPTFIGPSQFANILLVSPRAFQQRHSYRSVEGGDRKQTTTPYLAIDSSSCMESKTMFSLTADFGGKDTYDPRIRNRTDEVSSTGYLNQ